MQNKINIPLETIIAKIDNDFNPDNSDWINRVPAWCIDALNQLKLLSYVNKKIKVNVYDKIARFNCCIDDNLKVYDKNGCEIEKLTCRCKIYGRDNQDVSVSSTIDVVNNEFVSNNVYSSISLHNNTDDVREQHSVINRSISPVGGTNRNYVILSNNQIELNFDTDFIYAEIKTVATQYSDYFKEEIPVIPNNGLLIEALTYYCMYKMLCRGMKHPVFNLSASQYGTNPYYMWMNLKDKAKASVINSLQDLDTDEWRNYFYNSTFPKK